MTTPQIFKAVSNPEIRDFVPTSTHSAGFPREDWDSFTVSNGGRLAADAANIIRTHYGGSGGAGVFRVWFHRPTAEAIFAEGDPSKIQIPFAEGNASEAELAKTKAAVVAHAKAWLASRRPNQIWKAAVTLALLETKKAIGAIAALPDNGNPEPVLTNPRAFQALWNHPKETIMAARILAAEK